MTEYHLHRADGRITPARFVASPNCAPRPPDAQIEVIVIHAISLPPGEYGGDFVERFFTNQLNADAHPYFQTIHTQKVSAHFFIPRTGELIQFVPTHQCAWHAGESAFRGREKVNEFSIGIELEGCDDDEFETAQYKKLTGLCRFLIKCYPAITTQNIVGHNDIAPTRKTDPGPGFDWQRFRRNLPDQSKHPPFTSPPPSGGD